MKSKIHVIEELSKKRCFVVLLFVGLANVEMSAAEAFQVAPWLQQVAGASAT